MQDNQLHDLVVPEIDALGFELVKLEVVGGTRNPVLRLFIDKSDGVTISDCTLVSRTVALLLEEADAVPRALPPGGFVSGSRSAARDRRTLHALHR